VAVEVDEVFTDYGYVTRVFCPWELGFVHGGWDVEEE